MAYMFVHDGLVHRRFPVGPIANVPYLRKVAAAHYVSYTLPSPQSPVPQFSIQESQVFRYCFLNVSPFPSLLSFSFHPFFHILLSPNSVWFFLFLTYIAAPLGQIWWSAVWVIFGSKGGLAFWWISFLFLFVSLSLSSNKNGLQGMY